MRDKKGKTFANPFGSLKGFSVSPPKEPPPPARAAAQEPESSPAELFAREMERLGVKEKGAGCRSEPPASSAPEPERKEPASEEELFLAALGEMDSRFVDAWEEPVESRPSPLRMRQVKQGKLLPEADLDLHGLNRSQARQKVRNFLENSLWQGLRAVRIVTGRGVGSEGEPVLRHEIELFLRDQAGDLVVEWGRAPGRLGGEGALIVFLRKKK